jgi:hypothetical protein
MSSSWKRTFRAIFKHPIQVRKKHRSIVALVGRIGFLTKSFIYATIGALTATSAFTDKVNNESPQGVFILLGSLPNATGRILLLSMFCGIAIYATWRFWEGLTGQGYDPTYSKKTNFFKYRLSPIASGIVYVAYGAYIIYLFFQQPPPPGESFQPQGTCFPICWRHTIIGNIGIALLALAFTIATITQLIVAFTGNFVLETDFSKFVGIAKYIRIPYLISGRIGFFARAVLFFLVCFLFWNVLFGTSMALNPNQSTVAQAISNIQSTLWGTIIMGCLGIGLIIYGLFAFLCIFFKIFPTPPPSTNTTMNTDVDTNIQLEQLPS